MYIQDVIIHRFPKVKRDNKKRIKKEIMLLVLQAIHKKSRKGLRAIS